MQLLKAQLILGELGKLLLKVLHYNIALLPKKLLITLLSYFFMESNALHYWKNKTKRRFNTLQQ